MTKCWHILLTSEAQFSENCKNHSILSAPQPKHRCSFSVHQSHILIIFISSWKFRASLISSFRIHIPLLFPCLLFHSYVMCSVIQCPTLCAPRDCSPPGSSVQEILQARILELPCPLWGHLLNPGIQPRSPTLQVDSLPSEPPGKPPRTSNFARNL